ncbi:hypothetical protein [Nocardioides coralli]|uniref:hypothetical protein n=1 Tax=Nocardioides coralli TaxID=2872154 RepID=UPI001CA45FBC|nr:hypothetical protein [Nocardioides coralli]QZY28557.1 hypothetical protein K6T13_13970 [Nocardioides coralli]
MALVVDAGGFLTAAGVSDGTVDQILSMLEGSGRAVREKQDLQQVPAGALGAAATAQELQHHAGKAHAVVVQAMAEMVAGLEGYHASVTHFRKDVHDTDATQASELLRRQRRVDDVTALEQLALAEQCTQAATYDAEGCEVPGGSDA